MPRVGILGGAFNPPHLGHLVCAQEARLQLGLERVLLVPVGDPPHRELEDDPGPDARLEMTELAAAGDPGLSVSRIELDRPGPSYTADTLAALRDSAPEDELVLILGGDQAAALPFWHEPGRVLELAEVAAVERVNWPREEIVRSLDDLAGAERLHFVHMPLIEISSSDLRRRAAAGQPLRYLVPEPVAELIAERGLYT
ncbi:MAG: nicotinate (nicotinamide) nucleotide adenylyltransferase [Thermoleophilaceae bacterium]|nr:nicotinate (nicotinamide) nucleotide adenylyltransferase [Thermoleophilaceae bacterium]